MEELRAHESLAALAKSTGAWGDGHLAKLGASEEQLNAEPRTPPAVRKEICAIFSDSNEQMAKELASLDADGMKRQIKFLEQQLYYLQQQEERQRKAGLLLGVHPPQPGTLGTLHAEQKKLAAAAGGASAAAPATSAAAAAAAAVAAAAAAGSAAS